MVLYIMTGKKRFQEVLGGKIQNFILHWQPGKDVGLEG